AVARAVGHEEQERSRGQTVLGGHAHTPKQILGMARSRQVTRLRLYASAARRPLARPAVSHCSRRAGLGFTPSLRMILASQGGRPTQPAIRTEHNYSFEAPGPLFAGGDEVGDLERLGG